MASTAGQDMNLNSGRKKRRMFPVVDARFQWKYTMMITAIGAGVATIMGLFLYQAHQENTKLLELSELVGLREQVSRGDRIFLLYLIIFVLVMATALMLGGLVVTHRISGPLYLVARYLGDMADGLHPDLRPLRKRDELQAFFSAFEDATTFLRKRDEELLNYVEECLAAVKSAQDGNADHLKSALELLEKKRNTFHQSLSVRDLENND
ncbi:MAG: hypothetical protein QGI45_07115 [Myxococcota bacterium]|jgi:nitrogen fixation/metabolism regulation signal transduction histidine kinase|nr:hypothetical protein [Myxococcota bacterium]